MYAAGQEAVSAVLAGLYEIFALYGGGCGSAGGVGLSRETFDGVIPMNRDAIYDSDFWWVNPPQALLRAWLIVPGDHDKVGIGGCNMTLLFGVAFGVYNYAFVVYLFFGFYSFEFEVLFVEDGYLDDALVLELAL